MKKLALVVIFTTLFLTNSASASNFLTRTFYGLSSCINKNPEYFLLGALVAAYCFLPSAEAGNIVNACDLCPSSMTFDQLLNLASDQLTEQGRLELIESRILTNPDGIVLQKLISKEDTLKMLAAYKEYLTPEATCVMEIVNNNNIHDCAYVLLSVKDAVEQLAAVLGVFFHPNIVHGTL